MTVSNVNAWCLFWPVFWLRKKFILQAYKNFRGFGGSRRNHLKVAGFRATEFITTDLANDWQNEVLWVDDRPENNGYEPKAMESMDLEFTLVLSTDEALQILGVRRFAATISDMGRKEGPREGYLLLEVVRAKDKTTPFFSHSGSRAQLARWAAVTDLNHQLAAVDDGAMIPGRPGVRPTTETDSAALHFGLHCGYRNVSPQRVQVVGWVEEHRQTQPFEKVRPVALQCGSKTSGQRQGDENFLGVSHLSSRT